MRKTILFLIILFCFVNISSANIWFENDSLINGLSFNQFGVKPHAYYNISNDLNLYVSSELNNKYFNWNGTWWIESTSIGSQPSWANPSFYIDDGIRKILAGSLYGQYFGYAIDANNYTYTEDFAINDGLPGSTGIYSSSDIGVFNYSGSLKAITYNQDTWNGWDLNSSKIWVENSSIVNGISTSLTFGSFDIYYLDDNWNIIISDYNEDWIGITWNGTSWNNNSDLTNGLINGISATVFELDGTTRLLSGKEDPASPYFYGYDLNFNPTIPTSFTNLENTNNTPTITWTEGTDIEGDAVTTYIYVGTNSTPTEIEGSTTDESYILGTNITLADGVSYNYRLRSYDGYSFSPYTTSDSFTVNTNPSITNVTLTPDPTAVEDDLTTNNNTATDADGDPITLYYKWYKNAILQPSLTTSTVNASNTSNGELWKVGIIPNDGYENGTEVQSQTVEIGSSNSAPTLTGVNIDKSYPLKRYVNFTITTENATDVNGDSRKLEVGSATGLSDLGIGDYFTNGNESNITIAMPYYDGLQHTLYIRLNDSNITSQEYQLTLESDITKPVLNSESLSTTSTTQGLTVGITINTTSINSTIPSVTVSVSRPDATSANWTLSNTVNDTWYYNYLSTSDLGTYTVNYFTITDAGDNIKTAASSLSFTITAAVVTGGGGGGGGGSGGTTIIQTGDITDLTITPPRLDTYVLYAGFGEDRTLKYRFIVNRNITSCLVDSKEEYNDIATCTITDGYIVDVHLTINDSKGYSGTITVRDSDEFVATSDLIIRVLDIGAYRKIVNIPVGETIASMLNLFFASENGVLVGLRTWFMVIVATALSLIVAFAPDVLDG